MSDETNSATIENANPGQGVGENPTAEPRGGFAMSPALKFFVIAFLTGLLVIPLMVVWALSDDRDSRSRQVLSGIDRDWGGAQVVKGPMILVPVTRENANGYVEEGTVGIFPDQFTATVDADSDVRPVSIYRAAVYNATISAKGRFGPVDIAKSVAKVRSVDWERAVLAVGISDVGGIELAKVSLNGGAAADFQAQFGVVIGATTPPPNGIHLDLGPLKGSPETTGLSFDLTLGLRGNRSLAFVPVGQDSTVGMKSDWPHPSFVGRTLPSSYEITASGFEASWRVPALARTTPKVAFIDPAWSPYVNPEQTVGATFDDPVDTYAMVERALKYGVMFVAAVFGIIFLLEILSSRRIHVVQYTLVGLIVVFFYVLLLALAEHVLFLYAYLIASAATGGVVAAFVGLALSSAVRGVAAAVAFAAVFALLYMILTLEDVALLAGAITGFVALTVVLFATRRVDWSGRGADAEPAAPAA